MPVEIIEDAHISAHKRPAEMRRQVQTAINNLLRELNLATGVNGLSLILLIMQLLAKDLARLDRSAVRAFLQALGAFHAAETAGQRLRAESKRKLMVERLLHKVKADNGTVIH